MPGGSGIPRNDAECQNCGAPLPPPDDKGVRTCEFCGEVHAPPAAREPRVDIALTTSEGGIESLGATTTTTGRGCGLGVVIILVVVLVSVGLPVYFALGGAKKVFDALDDAGLGGSSAQVVDDSVLALPGEPGAPTGFVALASHYDSGASKSIYQIVGLDGSSSTPTWKSANLQEGTTRVPLATDAKNVYSADKSRVFALALGDGHQVWQQSLSDEVPLPCESCFFVIGNRLVVKSKDGIVHAFDTGSGTQAWSRRLQDVSAKIQLVGTSVLVIDGTAGDYSVSVLDPVSGAETQQFAPRCADTQGMRSQPIGYDSILLSSPGDTSVYLGFGIVPACWQRWDIATGAMAWNVTLDDSYLDHGAYGFVESGSIWFSGRDHETIGRIDTASGLFVALPPQQDLESVPVAVHGNTLILRGKTTRGTTKYALWGIDVTTGQQVWQFSLEGAEPADPPDAETIFVGSGDRRFTVHLDADRLRVVTLDGTTKALSVDVLDPDTGVGAPTGTIANATSDSLPDFTPVTWRGPTLLLALGSGVVEVDTATSSITYRWP